MQGSISMQGVSECRGVYEFRECLNTGRVSTCRGRIRMPGSICKQGEYLHGGISKRREVSDDRGGSQWQGII